MVLLYMDERREQPSCHSLAEVIKQRRNWLYGLCIREHMHGGDCYCLYMYNNCIDWSNIDISLHFVYSIFMCELIFRVKFTCCTVIHVNFSIAWSMLSCSEVNYTVLYFDWFGASVLVYIRMCRSELSMRYVLSNDRHARPAFRLWVVYINSYIQCKLQKPFYTINSACLITSITL